jgi:hypothetical protein
MELDFKRLLGTTTGRIVLSIILGIGFATVFRKICKDGSCIDFHGSVIGDLEEKIYQHDEKCYKYTTVASKCNPEVKRIVDIGERELEEGFFSYSSVKTD